MTTAHIRCGDDLRERLPAAGWSGEYLPIADPVCVGPVSDDDLMPYLGIRARVIALHAGVDLMQARLRLGREYAALSALDRHERVLLWFEHDLWDQAALIRVLSLLAGRRGLEGRLFMMPADGKRPFAALSDAELSVLQPQPLTLLQLEAGAAAWAAFADADPTELDRIWRRASPLPHLAPALRRHLQDLPWRADRLALTERQVLRAVAAGATTPEAVLHAQHREDAIFPQTDLMVLDLHRRLSDGPLRLLERDASWRLTPRGRAVLAGEERHRPPPRFLAGVTIRPDPTWLWDPRATGVHKAT